MADAQGRVSNAYLSNASLHLRPQSYARALSRNASRGLLITAGAAIVPLGRSRSGGIKASRSARRHRCPQVPGVRCQWRGPGAFLRLPNGAIAVSDTRLTNDKARRISKLIGRLP
jgi:hypothetical protein